MSRLDRFQNLQNLPDNNLVGYYVIVEQTTLGTKYSLDYTGNIFGRIWVYIKSLLSKDHFAIGKDLKGLRVVSADHLVFSPKVSQITKNIFPKSIKPKQNRSLDNGAILEKGQVPLVKSKGPFYHATKSPLTIQQIIFDGGVEVRHQGSYRGAFASQKPEYDVYGKYVLVFYDNLRTHKDGTPRSHLKYSKLGYKCNWIGFGKRLPTKNRYLAGVIIHSSVKNAMTERATLAADLFNLTGRKITVELSNNLKELDRSKIKKINRVIA